MVDSMKRAQYKRQQLDCFGDNHEENMLWDSYIHGESLNNEDILIGK